MNQMEIFKLTTEHKEHSEFLFYAKFPIQLEHKIKAKYDLPEEADLAEFFHMYRPAEIFPDNASGYENPDFSVYYRDVEQPEGSKINKLGVLTIPSRYADARGFVSPLRKAASIQDIENFPYQRPSMFNSGRMSSLVESAHSQNRVAETIVGHMYEDAWQLRGYEEFLMDMIQRPEWCEYILDRTMERNMYLAKSAAQAGVDLIKTGDDVANQRALMFSYDMWQKFIKSRWAEVFAAAKSINPDIKIWYHSDGNIESIVDDLIDIGVDILNPVQSECNDIYALKKKFGSRVVFDGTIGTQTTMPFGSPEEVRAAVRDRKKNLGYDGALIIAPTHVLGPEVPVENIEAFVEESRKTD